MRKIYVVAKDQMCPSNQGFPHCKCRDSERVQRCCYCSAFYSPKAILEWAAANGQMIQQVKRDEYIAIDIGADRPDRNLEDQARVYWQPAPAQQAYVNGNWDNDQILNWARDRLANLPKAKKETPQPVEIEGFDDDGSYENVN